MARKLRVLHVITGLNTGGAERFLCRLVTRMDRKRFESLVISLSARGVLVDELEKQGIPVLSVGLSKSKPSSLLNLASLPFHVRKFRPDLVQTWLYHGDFAGLGLRALGLAPKLLWNIRCSEVDFSQYFFVTRQIVKALARKSATPDAILHNSHAGRRAHEALGYHARRWVYLGNGLDLMQVRKDPDARASVLRELGLPADRRLVGMVARFDPMKGFDHLCSAIRTICARYPDVHFVLAGRGVGPEQAVFKDLPLGRVSLLGERKDVVRLMSALDVLVMSSIFGEGFPNVVAEAMACGAPCVVTDVGDAAFIVGETGKVVPPAQPERLESALSELLDLPPAQLAQKGEDARKRVEANFSLESVTAQYEALYASLAPGA